VIPKPHQPSSALAASRLSSSALFFAVAPSASGESAPTAEADTPKYVRSTAYLEDGSNFGMQTIAPTGALYINDQQQPQEPPLHSTYSAMPFFWGQGDSRSECSSAGRHSNYSAQQPEYMDDTHDPYCRASSADTVHQTDALLLPYQVPLVSGSGGLDEYRCPHFYATGCPSSVVQNRGKTCGEAAHGTPWKAQNIFFVGPNDAASTTHSAEHGSPRMEPHLRSSPYLREGSALPGISELFNGAHSSYSGSERSERRIEATEGQQHNHRAGILEPPRLVPQTELFSSSAGREGANTFCRTEINHLELTTSFSFPFERLTDEIRQKVFTNLDYQDLISLSKTSRFLNQNVKPQSMASLSSKLAFVRNVENFYKKHFPNVQGPNHPGNFACYICFRVRGPAHFVAEQLRAIFVNDKGQRVPDVTKFQEVGGYSKTSDIRPIELRRFCIKCGVKEGFHLPGDLLVTKLKEEFWICQCRVPRKKHTCLMCTTCGWEWSLRFSQAQAQSVAGNDGA